MSMPLAGGVGLHNGLQLGGARTVGDDAIGPESELLDHRVDALLR